jgi:xylose isomerase
MFIGHIGAMDAFARGLRIAAKMHKDGLLEKMVNDRYATFKSNKLGKAVESGKATFEQLEKYAMKQGEPKCISGK